MMTSFNHWLWKRKYSFNTRWGHAETLAPGGGNAVTPASGGDKAETLAPCGDNAETPAQGRDNAEKLDSTSLGEDKTGLVALLGTELSGKKAVVFRRESKTLRLISNTIVPSRSSLLGYRTYKQNLLYK